MGLLLHSNSPSVLCRQFKRGPFSHWGRGKLATWGQPRAHFISYTHPVSASPVLNQTVATLRFVSMGMNRQMLFRRNLLLPDHSGGKVEAGSRLKLEPNKSYLHKLTPPYFTSRSIWTALIPGSPWNVYPVLTFPLANCRLLFTLFLLPYCRVLIDNLQAAVDAQFDSKARTATHSYEKYNTWEMVKSRSWPHYQLSWAQSPQFSLCSQNGFW